MVVVGGGSQGALLSDSGPTRAVPVCHRVIDTGLRMRCAPGLRACGHGPYGPGLQLQQLCASFNYYSPDSRRDVSSCMFNNTYYGGMTSEDAKKRLREIKFAYRVDQKLRTTYKVRGRCLDGSYDAPPATHPTFLAERGRPRAGSRAGALCLLERPCPASWQRVPSAAQRQHGTAGEELCVCVCVRAAVQHG